MATAAQVIQMLKRKQGNLTQKEFAETIGISESYLCEIYKGTRNPAGKILEYLGLKKEVAYR